MNVAVWDTYVTKKDGNVMHFDIIAPIEMGIHLTRDKFEQVFLSFLQQKASRRSANQGSG